MFKLSDKESAYIYTKCTLPLVWLTLSNKSGNEVTDALVKRAYAAVSCRNPLLRGVHKPEVAKFSLVIKDVKEVIQEEVEDKLPAHITKEFHTREEAWEEYKKKVEYKFWKSDAMWEVIVCVLDKEPASSDANCVVFGHFNHGIADGAAAMAAIGQFVHVLSAGLASNSLPPHNFLGESLPIPKPFHERYPTFKYDDPTSDEDKEVLFAKINKKLSTEGSKMHCAIVDKSFTEEATKKFISKCKKHGVSFTAGLFAAVAVTTSVKKMTGLMPISFRTKDDWDEIAVSFTSSSFNIDVTSILAGVDAKDEEATWAVLAKEFHKEIRRKVETPEEKYRGMAISFIRPALNDVEMPVNSPITTGPNNDELAFCLSNVGILDKYFVDDGPLTVTDVTGYGSNSASPVVVLWCYTFRGKFRFAALDAAYAPRREVFEKFVNKIIDFVENN